MKKTTKLTLGMVAAMLVGMTGFGGTIVTNRLEYPTYTNVMPEFWAMSGIGYSPVEGGGSIQKARIIADSPTGEVYTLGWGGYSPSWGIRSYTDSWYNWAAGSPYYQAATLRLRVYFTVDMRGYGASNGYQSAYMETPWRYGLLSTDGHPPSPNTTNRLSLALGRVTQVRYTYWAGWYLGEIYTLKRYGYESLAPSLILVQEISDHQPKAQTETPTQADNAGDPINIQNGNVSLDETDVGIPTPNIPLAFKRTYGSLHNQSGILGSRWTHAWDWQVSTSNSAFNGVTNQWLIFRRGVYTSYKELDTPTNSGNSAHATDDGFQWTAATNLDGTWNISMAGGLLASFNGDGMLSRLGDSWSNAVQLTYSNQLPITLAHSGGKSLTLEYTDALLSKITTPSTNFYLRYFYSTNGLLTNAVTYADGSSYSTAYLWDETNQVITQRMNAIGDVRCWEYEGQTGKRSWVGTNRWYDTSVALPTNGSYRSWVTEHGDSTNVLYAWDFNPIFQKPDQISGPMPYNGSFSSYESEENGTNIITMVFYPNNTNELESCMSNAYFQTLNATYGIMSTASQQVTYPVTQNTYDDRGNKTAEKVEEYSGSATKTYSLSKMNYDSQDRMTNFGFGFNASPTSYYSIAWDEEFQLPSRQADPEGHEVSWAYANGVVAKEAVQVSSGISNETVYAYTTNGLLGAVTNANSHALQISYDASCNPTSIVFPETPTVEMTWTDLGYLNEIKMPSDSYDTNGVMVPRTTLFTADSRGYVNSIAWADGLVDHYYRDSIGQVTSWVDRVGRRTDYSFLSTRKLASVIRHLGSQPVTIRADYDKQFNTLQISDPLNRVVESYQLDNQGRPVRVGNVNSQTMEIAYVMGDMVNTIKRFDGTSVSNTYTGDGWLGAVKYPDENVTFGYFKDGLLKTASNPTGTIAITYNNAHQVLSVSNAVPKGLVSYSVDGLGQATSTVWNGIGITRGHTAGEQLNYVKVPTGEVFLSYNGLNGLLAGVSNAAGLSAEYSYNSMDQVTGIAWRNASGDVIRSWAYALNGLGFVTDVENEDGEVSQYQYDGLDQLATARQWNAAGELMTDERFAYDLAGNRTNKDSSGVSVDYVQGSGDWLTSWKVTTTDLVGSIDVYGASSEAIGTNNRYGSLYVSNDVAVTPAIDGTNFSVYMLPVNLGTQQVVAAIRDVAGNMGYATGTVFLTIVTNGLYSIDSAGCVTNIKYTGVQYSNNRGIKWDGQYRIKEVLTNGASCERYGFDPLGRRVVTVSGGVTNFHVYDGVHVLADTDATGGVLRVYGHGLGIDHLLTMTTYTSGTAKTYYYLTDRLGSVHALADEAGNVVESYRFDAWGKVTGVYDGSGNHLSESAYGNRFLWQGREYSYRTGLYYFRARFYDPVMGRWLSNDPIGIAGGLNQYVFCGNNPVMGQDPEGLSGFLMLGSPWLIFFEKPPIIPRPILDEAIRLNQPKSRVPLPDGRGVDLWGKGHRIGPKPGDIIKTPHTHDPLPPFDPPYQNIPRGLNRVPRPATPRDILDAIRHLRGTLESLLEFFDNDDCPKENEQQQDPQSLMIA